MKCPGGSQPNRWAKNFSCQLVNAFEARREIRSGRLVVANGIPVKTGLSSVAGRRQLSANPGRAIQLSSGQQNSNLPGLHHQSVRLSARNGTGFSGKPAFSLYF